METAALLDAYTHCSERGEMPPSPDEVFITKPGSPEAIIRGTKAWMPCTTPWTFTPWPTASPSVPSPRRSGSRHSRRRCCTARGRRRARRTRVPRARPPTPAWETSAVTPRTSLPSSPTAVSRAAFSTSAITTFAPRPGRPWRGPPDPARAPGHHCHLVLEILIDPLLPGHGVRPAKRRVYRDSVSCGLGRYPRRPCPKKRSTS